MPVRDGSERTARLGTWGHDDATGTHKPAEAYQKRDGGGPRPGGTHSQQHCAVASGYSSRSAAPGRFGTSTGELSS